MTADLRRETATCPNCGGEGWVLVEGYTLGCCGDYLPSGECCSAKYGSDRLVAEPTQEQDACPTCGGSGEAEVR